MDERPSKVDVTAADFLFTPTVRKILGAVLRDPQRTFTLRELMSLAGAGRGGAQQQIERLLEAGVLVEDARRGRQRSLRANTDFFLYPELSSIVKKTFGIREPLLQALMPFRDEIEEAFVFGSMAKGSDTARSDIDLLVIGGVPLRTLTAPLLETEAALGRSIHLTLYDPHEWRELVASDPVVAQIARGPRLELIEHAKAT